MIKRPFLTLYIFMVLCLWEAASPAFAETSFDKAMKAFKEEHYDQAIIYLRRHLRTQKKDAQAWNILGSAYYHSGRPGKALKVLKAHLTKAGDKTYNYYYQGLSFEALAKPINAGRAYLKAGEGEGEYAERAVFQIALLEYHQPRRAAAKSRAKQYLKRYPQGFFKKRAHKMLGSLEKGTYLPHLEGAKKPDLVAATMRYSPLSLFETIPHYWYLQGGYAYELLQVLNPRDQGEVAKEGYAYHALNTAAALGFGPFSRQNSSFYFGYQYVQKWLADQNRFATWLNDPTDFEYFAFRPDLLHRYHQLVGRFEKKLNSSFSFGLEGVVEKAYIGSKYLPGPDSDQVAKVVELSETQFFLPWLQYDASAVYSIQFYLYVQRVLDKQEPAFSHQSLSLFSNQRNVSFGVTQLWQASPKFKLKMDLFHYGFLYNDYWLDHNHDGGFVEGTFALRSFELRGLIGLYRDDYNQQIIRSGSCDDKGASVGGDPVLCYRSDTGLFLQGAVAWHLSPYQQFSAKMSQIKNNNDKIQVFTSSRLLFTVDYTLAFPGVRQLAGFLPAFGDLSQSRRLGY